MATKGVQIPIQARDQTGQAFASVNNKLAGLKSKLGAVTGAFKGLIGVMSVALFARAAKESLDFADKLEKLNRTIGSTPEFLSQMRFAAEQSGVGFAALEKGMKKMVDTIDAGATGTKLAAQAFARLGIDVNKLAKFESVEDQFMVLAEAFNELPAGANKAAIGMEIFGAKGLELVQAMDGGAAAILQLRDEADQLGATLSQDQVESAAAANDAINRLGTAFKGLVNILAVSVGPALEAISNFLTNVLPVAVGSLKTVFNGVRAALAGVLAGLVGTLRGAAELLAPFSDTAAEVAATLGSVEAALMKSSNKWADASAANAQETKTAWGEFLVQATDTSVAVDKTTEAVRANTAAVLENKEAVAMPVLTLPTIQEGLQKDKPDPFKDLEDRAMDLEGMIANAINAGSQAGAKSMAQNLLQSLNDVVIKGFTEALSKSMSNLFSGAGGGGFFGGLLKMFGFANGGVVPGPRGAPRLALVHGGETILPTHKGGGGAGGVSIHNTINAGAGANRAEIEMAIRASEKRTLANVQDLMKRRRLV